MKHFLYKLIIMPQRAMFCIWALYFIWDESCHRNINGAYVYVTHHCSNLGSAGVKCSCSYPVCDPLNTFPNFHFPHSRTHTFTVQSTKPSVPPTHRHTQTLTYGNLCQCTDSIMSTKERYFLKEEIFRVIKDILSLSYSSGFPHRISRDGYCTLNNAQWLILQTLTV